MSALTTPQQEMEKDTREGVDVFTKVWPGRAGVFVSRDEGYRGGIIRRKYRLAGVSYVNFVV
jgi:hypothetical protein